MNIHILKDRLLFYQKSIIETKTNFRVFEENIKNQYISNILVDVISMLEKHHGYIGKSVYKYNNIPAFTTLEDYKEINNRDTYHSLFNTLGNIPVIFTEEKYKEFEKNYIETIIESEKKDIFENPYLGSSNQFQNLLHLFRIDAKKKVIELLKS